jgi:hypothetical protein
MHSILVFSISYRGINQAETETYGVVPVCQSFCLKLCGPQGPLGAHIYVWCEIIV